MFFYTVQVDQENRMTNFFRRDERSRIDYDCFGDVVVFDTTYRTNSTIITQPASFAADCTTSLVTREMGEEKKEEKEEEEKKKEGKDEKKEEEPPEILLKVDMHCEACARKVARALKGFEAKKSPAVGLEESRRSEHPDDDTCLLAVGGALTSSSPQLQVGQDLPSGQPVFVGPASSPGKSGLLELDFLLGLPPASGLGSSLELLLKKLTRKRKKRR
ncbi:unnamed protein product [Prunus brigantina]